ncbi:MAG: glycosyltransferase, partial [Bdellovibrionales bacterium]|nr:glycosyltransferase [Bdellovibrionales bacterium]
MKVLISRPDKIGDVVLALHCGKQLKRLCPDIKLYFQVAPYTKDLVSSVKFLDGVVTFGEDLTPYHFDAVVDLMAKFDTARHHLAPRIPIRVGNSARWFSFLYNRRGYVRRSRALQNEAEYNWSLVSLVDKRLAHTRLRDALTVDDFSSVPQRKGTEPYDVFFPGVSVSAQAWDFERWVTLCRESVGRFHRKVIVLLGPAEKSLAERFRESFSEDSQIEVLETSRFSELLGLLRDCTNYVGPSTGVTHLASACGVFGVALYPESRSMHPARWSPFRSSLTTLYPASELTPDDVLYTLEHGVPREYKRDQISAFVICKNEEKNIERCLDSLSWCDEIVVVDSGSEDKTLDICRAFPRVRIIERGWPGHREQKQFALEQCQYPWVLNLDADEELSSELKGRILHILEESKRGVPVAHGYFLMRLIRFLDKWWDKGGWHPEYRMRFFQRKHAQWGGVNPHEKAVVMGKVKRLPGFIYHYTFDDLTQLMDTQNRFSLQSAKALYEAGVRSSMFKIILRPIFRFFKFYIVKRGFLEGKEGFFAAVTEGTYTFLKYSKLWEIEKLNPHPPANLSSSVREEDFEEA